MGPANVISENFALTLTYNFKVFQRMSQIGQRGVKIRYAAEKISWIDRQMDHDRVPTEWGPY